MKPQTSGSTTTPSSSTNCRGPNPVSKENRTKIIILDLWEGTPMTQTMMDHPAEGPQGEGPQEEDHPETHQATRIHGGPGCQEDHMAHQEDCLEDCPEEDCQGVACPATIDHQTIFLLICLGQ